MQTVIRPKFADTPLDFVLLQSIADLWLAWHREVSDRISGGPAFQRAQAELWGLARPDLDLRQEQLARSASRQLPNSSVELSDPDTLTVTTPWIETSRLSALPTLVDLFAGAEFDGLRLTLRLTAADGRRAAEGRPSREGTLVICTELRGGVPLLKAVWPADLSSHGETLFHFATWPGEAPFWQAVHDFRKNGTVSSPPEKLFVSPARQRVRRGLRWLIADVGEHRTLAAFAGRVAFFAAAAAALLIAGYQLGSIFLMVFSILPLKGLAYVLFKKARYISSLYRVMQASQRRLYSQSYKYAAVELPSVARWPEACACKYTRELEALGFAQRRDFRAAIHTRITGCYRLFMLPAERIYVILNLLYGTEKHVHFPVKVWCLGTTYFTDGTRLLMTSEGGGYRKSRDPLAIHRFYPEVEDSAVLLDRLRATIAHLIAEGKELAPPMSPDELLARVAADHDRVAELTRRAGYYTWRAAVRQSFKLVRREYVRRP
jgi:hypothetical protein